MKPIRWVYFFIIASALTLSGCIQYASGYKRSTTKKAAEVNGDVSPEASGEEESSGDEEVSEEPTTDDEVVDETTAEGEVVDETALTGSTGDLNRGQALLAACSTCHRIGGEAALVVLDASVIGRLDAAYKASKKPNHVTVHDSFIAPARSDLEAALKAIKAPVTKK